MTCQTEYLMAPATSEPVSARPGLRVCHIMSADLWAGAEVQVATTLSYLVERPDVRVIAVLFNEGRLACELRGLGIEVAVADERRRSSLEILIFLIRFLRDRDVDVVHTHRYKDTVLGAIAAKVTGVPYLIRTVHGLREPMRGWDRVKFSAYDALDKAALQCFADRVIAVSRTMAETLKQSAYRHSSITHIHNGLDLRRVKAARSREEVRRELGVGPRTFLVGTVGRLTPVKGHADFLRAAARILQLECDARFLIVGGGPLRDELTTLARELGLDRECMFTGPRDDIYDLVGAMDVFVLPSLDEGIPMALLEAMVLGKPVVATRVGGVPEVVRHRKTGLLVEPQDERGLASACLEVAANRQWAEALGARARRLVESEFSQTNNGRELMKTYLDVVSGSHGHRSEISVLTLFNALPVALLQRVRRRLRYTVERWRMARIRRKPAALTTALQSATSILIVCYGNIIRSPFAERLVVTALGERRRVRILSAGLEAVPGRPAHETAAVTAGALRVDLHDHVATPLTPECVASSDIIFVMDVDQLLEMQRRFPDARARTFLLTCLAPEVPLEVRDPIDGDQSVFQACYDHIARAVRPIVGVLSAAPQRS